MEYTTFDIHCFSVSLLCTEGGTIMRELIPPLAKRSKREDSPHDANDCTVVNKTPCGPTKPMVETGCGRTNYSELDETAEELAVIIKNSSDWILDIDLDFFSTGNPFKSQYTTVWYLHHAHHYHYVNVLFNFNAIACYVCQQ